MQPVYEEYDDEAFEQTPPRRRQRIEEQETTLFSANGRPYRQQPAGPPSDAWGVPGRSGKKKPQQKQRKPDPQERRQQPEYPASRGPRSQGYIDGEYREGPVSAPRQAPPPPPSFDIVQRPEFEQGYEEVSTVPHWFDRAMLIAWIILLALMVLAIFAGFLGRHIGLYQWLFH